MLQTIKEYAQTHNLHPEAVKSSVVRGTTTALKIKSRWYIDPETPYLDKSNIRRVIVDQKQKSYSRVYNIWRCMKNRCYSPKHKEYYNYGGRGISICDEWLHDSTAFIEWALENGYDDNLQIDRIDNYGNYEPSNCRWVTAKENCNNKRKRAKTKKAKITRQPRKKKQKIKIPEFDHRVDRIAYRYAIGDLENPLDFMFDAFEKRWGVPMTPCHIHDIFSIHFSDI